jgi:hypothetical protein
MRLEDLATSAMPIPLVQIGADVELTRQVQTCLAQIGLLDPPVDGKFGNVSMWAISEFMRRIGTPNKQHLDVESARALTGQGAGDLFPLEVGDDLGGRIVAALRSAGHWINRHPACLNVVYVEGMDTSGKPNPNTPNVFNDLRVLLRASEQGKPEIVGLWEATSEPGAFFTGPHKLSPLGAARIAFGQYKSWVVGTHAQGKKSAHEALVQADDITAHRDLDENFERHGDLTFTGMFGINQHWGFDLPKNDIGNASAGCLVGRTKDGHKEFMALLKQDPRFKASRGYRFMTSVMSSAAVADD